MDARVRAAGVPPSGRRRLARGRNVISSTPSIASPKGRSPLLALAAGLALALSLASPLGAAAQPAGTAAASAREPSAADRQAAGQAYDRASAAYLNREYARAGNLFEMAYRLAPASAALVQAVRSYERAGDSLRAGTLALRLQAFYGSERRSVSQAEETIAAVRGSLVRVDVTCNGSCALELDGVLEEHTSFFASPGEAHVVRATFETGVVEREVRGAPGETRALSLEAPPRVAVSAPEAPSEEPAAGSSGGGGAPSSDAEPSAGISPIAFFVVGGLAVISGAVLVWSGIDTLDGVPIYEAYPTEANLRVGQLRELRTNVLIGITGAFAITAAVLAAFTDWSFGGDGAASSDSGDSGDSGGSLDVAVSLTPETFALSLGGRF